MSIPTACRAAVFEGVGQPLRIDSVPLVSSPAGHILGKVRMATICGSDLHTFTGRRTEPIPLVLGHEVVAEVATLGKGVNRSSTGKPLKVGDRISFTIMASCGKCSNCRTGLPQKCESLFKYGHTSLSDGPGLNGGFAEYICLRPGTGVFHVPPGLSDKEVCPANCALATVINGLETIGVQPEERILIQGAGLLGLYTAALVKEGGASEVVVTDIDDSRLQMARRFKADEVLNVQGMNDDEIIHTLGRSRFDCVVEVSGDPAVVSSGLELLGLRGRYLIIGLVCAGSHFTVDGNTITRNYLTIKGIHNYAQRHLAEALDFLKKTKSSFPYEGLISRILPLAEIQAAFELALDRHGIRVAVTP